MNDDFETSFIVIMGFVVSIMVGITFYKIWDTNAKVTDIQNMLNIEYGE